MRPNQRRESLELWSLERQAAGIEPGELALKPGFGRYEAVRLFPLAVLDRLVPFVLLISGLVGLVFLFLFS